jgi:hypothetical protein
MIGARRSRRRRDGAATRIGLTRNMSEGMRSIPNRVRQFDRPWPLSRARWNARNDALCIKNSAKADIPKSAIAMLPRRPFRGSGRPPRTKATTRRLVAADAAFYSEKNETAAKAKGVKRVCIRNRSTKSPARKREERKRGFRNGQKWRPGCEGRISVAKRRHGLNRWVAIDDR